MCLWNRTWAFQPTAHGNCVEKMWLQITCLCHVAPNNLTFNNQLLLCVNMDRPQGSDALKQYPLYGTPYTRYFGSTFNPSQSPSTVLSLQSYSWRPPRSCNCPCNCAQIASSTPLLLSMWSESHLKTGSEQSWSAKKLASNSFPTCSTDVPHPLLLYRVGLQTPHHLWWDH